jgi:hypothetical protein
MANPVGALGGPTQGLFGGPNQNIGTPTIDTSGTAGWQGDPTKTAGNQGMQQTAEQLALAQANGTGPSAATDAARQQEQQAQAGMGALAASGSGSSGNALAKRQAMIQGGAAQSALGGQAATARAQEQIAGGQQLANVTGQARGQDIQNAGIQAGLATNQAQIAEQQNQVNAASAAANAGQNQQMLGSVAGMAAGAAMFADADVGQTDFVEPPGKAKPGGEAHWTLREEKGFILARNQLTGQNFKLATVPLTPQEEAEAKAPHGAGPLGANDPKRKHSQMADGEMGAPPQGGMVKEHGPQNFAEVVRRAHPKLYKAAFADGDIFGGKDPNATGEKQTPGAPYAAPGPQLGQAMADSSVTGRDSGGNPYAVPGFVPPQASYRGANDRPGSGNEWEDANKLSFGETPKPSEQAHSNGGYGSDWDKPIRNRGGAAPGDAETDDTSAEAVQASGKNPDGSLARQGGGVRSAIGGALMGFSNPNALSKLAFQKAGASKPDAAVQFAQPDPTQTVSDGELATPMSAMDRASKKIEGARAEYEAGPLLDELSHMKVAAVRAADVPNEQTSSLLKHRSGYQSDAHEPYIGSSGRILETLGQQHVHNGVPTEHRVADRGEAASQFNDADLDVRVGGRDNPVDLDDPMAVWSAEKELAAPGEARRMAREMEAMNPYRRGGSANPVDLDAGDTENMSARAAFDDDIGKVRTSLDRPKPMVSLFAANRKAPNVGPTDWMAAMRKDANLPGAIQDWQKDEAETAAREALVGKKLGLNLVPGEMAGISLSEAKKRTKSRSAVQALREEWEAEKRTPQHGPPPESAYAMNDGDLRAAAGSALSKLGISKRKKVA